MFGLFSRKKKFDFVCPMCGREYAARFNPSEVTDYDYPHWPGKAELMKQKCDFCKVEMTLLLTKRGSVFAIDEKWQLVQNKHNEALEIIVEQVEDIEYEGITPALEKKKAQLESKQAKLEDSFETKEIRYYDRQATWQEKWMKKEH